VVYGMPGHGRVSSSSSSSVSAPQSLLLGGESVISGAIGEDFPLNWTKDSSDGRIHCGHVLYWIVAM
jgi:hypothetical protein